MKTAQQAATKYGANGSAPTATALWALNFNSGFLAMLDKAAAAAGTWQAAVADPATAARFQRGLQKAKNKQATVAAKVNGAGSTSLAAGVRAAATGAYLTFSNAWMQAVGSEVATLDQTNARGTRAQNRQRQAAYDAWIDQQKGNFKQ